MARPRVLLLDDDASVRCFVRLALSDLPIELIECDGCASARDALHTAPCALLITDLVLRDESGIDFLHELRHEHHLIGDARVLVLSAGLDAPARQRLAELAIWRMLPKPASLAQLQAATREALALAAREAPRAEAGSSPTPIDAEAQAMQQHFGGDAALFAAFRSTCWAQFPDDLAAADAARAAGDAPALRRVAHSLKTVLRLIGRPDLARQATDVDEAAAAADWARLGPQWAALRDALGAALAEASQPAVERPAADAATGVGRSR